MNIIGNLESKVETIERASEVKILISFLPKKPIAEDSHCDSLISPLTERLVDLNSFFKLDSVSYLGPRWRESYFFGI